MKAKPTVAILGGGIGGLSAAHELAERGFAVTIFEARPGPGGKARSIFVPGTGRDGRRDLPGEHGFRFFPSFYRHVPDTMSRIPFGRNARGVLDNLTATSRTRLARLDAPAVDVITRFPHNAGDVLQMLRTIVLDDFGLPWRDVAHISALFLMLLTTCPERRMAEHEHARWWDFIGADRRSAAFRRYFADISVRSLVAMCPRRANTRTIGSIGMRIWLDHARPGQQVDRLLDGPTQDRWITPWVEHLGRLGVQFEYGARAVALAHEGARLVGVDLETPSGPRRITADHYVAALPVERMRALVTPALAEAAPSLGGLEQLATEWMTGVQFFLDVPSPVVPGHLVFSHSPWALTGISQAQFWPSTNLRRFGDGRVRGVLSMIISNWDVPGTHIRKPANACSAAELRDELWWQVKSHLRHGKFPLEDRNLVDWYLADSIELGPDGPRNHEPLFINTAGSWRHRPEALTELENLFLAADYVRTHTDLATMESANEAARRAVNGVLAATGVSAQPCQVWELAEPAAFRPSQALDRQRLARGLPHLLAPLVHREDGAAPARWAAAS